MTALLQSKMLMGGRHRESARTSEVWLTPPWLLAAVGGWESFDLDPCAPIMRPWPTARRHYTIVDNGLLLSWHGRVWLNPPYGRSIGRWLGRMAAHDRGLALIFARTDTDAFFRHVWERATALLFLRGRLEFLRGDGTPAPKHRDGKPQNAGAPSLLAAYGTDEMDRLAACDVEGQFVPLRMPRGVLVLGVASTWREVVLEWLRDHRGAVALGDLYRAFASHPKAQRNPNYQAKIRQVLQKGPFRRVERGRWAVDQVAA